MADVTLPDVMCAAERIRAAIAEQRVEGVAVTASIGVAHEAGIVRPLVLEELLERADAALYSAKNAGRNRSGMASPDAAGRHVRTSEYSHNTAVRHARNDVVIGSNAPPNTLRSRQWMAN